MEECLSPSGWRWAGWQQASIRPTADYTRWLLLETLIMDTEAAFLTQLQGNQFLNVLWRGMGARVSANTCIFASSLGCEFDLKDIGDDVALQYQSLASPPVGS